MITHMVNCVFPDDVKDINRKVFNPLSKTNETRYLSGHETCTCKCKLDGSLYQVSCFTKVFVM